MAMTLPLPAKAYALAMPVLAVATFAATRAAESRLLGPATAWPWAWTDAPAGAGLGPAAICGALVAVAAMYPIRLGDHRKLVLDDAVQLTAVLLLPGAAAMTAIGLGTAAGNLVLLLQGRRDRWNVVFNAGKSALAVGLASLASRGVLRTAEAFQSPIAMVLLPAGAIVAAAMTLYVANTLSVCVIAGLQQGKNPLDLWLVGRRSDWPAALALYVVGLCATLATQERSATVLLLLVPAALAMLAVRKTVHSLERQLAEQAGCALAARLRLAAIVESVQEAIIGVTTDGTVSDWNPGAERLYGYTQAEMVGQSLERLYPAGRRKEAASLLQQALSGERVGPCEMVHQRRDGHTVPVAVSLSPLRDPAGGLQGVAIVVRDVSEQKRTEEILRQQHRQLREAMAALRATQEQVVQQERLRALGEMASGIAHDLNNALAPVVGFSELLLTELETSGGMGGPASRALMKSYLELILTGACDAAAIVGRLREFYRHREAGEHFGLVELEDVVRQAVLLTQPKWKDQAQVEGRTIVVRTELQPVPPVTGNAAELREVLTNLIFNAVDALPHGGTITIATAAEEEHVILAVRDTGVGMSEAVRRRCLEPFFTTKGERGTGLGLAVAHGILRRHGATLHVASSPGKGSCFFIRFPLGSASEAAGQWMREVNAHDADWDGEEMMSSALPAAPLRVLVVDDELVVRDVLASYLTLDGHEVRSVGSAYEALQEVRTGQFDLVLTDRAMPHLNGDQLAAAIKEVEPELPVVLVTGFGDLMLAAGQQPPGVDAILRKPVTRRQLRETLASLELPRRRRRLWQLQAN